MDISPELQNVIDKVTGYANKPIGGARGQTAAQGRALLGVGEMVKDIQTSGMDIASKEKIAAGTLASGTEKTGIEAGLEEKKLGIEQQQVDLSKAAIPKYLQGLITSNLGVGGMKETMGDDWPKKINPELLKLWPK